MAGGDDFANVDPPRQRVKLLAPGQQKNGDDRVGYGEPRRQRERDGANYIGVYVERRYDQPNGSPSSSRSPTCWR